MAGGESDTLSFEAISYLIHHVVLPPKLPQANDFDPGLEQCLLQTTIRALHDFKNICPPEASTKVEYVASTISNLLKSKNQYGYINEEQLAIFMRRLAAGDDFGAIPLEIKAQNAALLVWRSSHGVTIEAFELSPSNESVLAGRGRLARSFPAVAVELNISQFAEEDFRGSVARAISKMSFQPAEGFQPQVSKAGSQHDEERDTTHPGMVTDYFMNVLKALGVATEPSRVWKNTREEVMWSNSKLPWLRAPLWLLVRVAMQTCFSRKLVASEHGSDIYKAFMAFFLSRILDHARHHIKSLKGDVLFTISAKIARRLRKLTQSLGQMAEPPPWLERIHESMRLAHDCQETTWENIRNGVQSRQHLTGTALNSLQPSADVDVAIPALDCHIAGLKVRGEGTKGEVFQPSSILTVFPPNQLPGSLLVNFGDCHVGLGAFEAWVEKHLGSWVDSHIGTTIDLDPLRRRVEEYHSMASQVYNHDPRRISVMYLTILELWVACDRLTCQMHPLLNEYDPEIPVQQFQLLLLPLKTQLQRLGVVERHLRARQDASRPKPPSVFTNFGHAESFAVKYFDQSPSHLALKQRIEREATQAWEAKRRELLDKRARYQSLMAQHHNMQCESYSFTTHYGSQEVRHRTDCGKCRIVMEAQRIVIQICEWPLSSDEARAKATVFELAVPAAFGNWRDLSLFLLKDVLRCEYSRNSKPIVSFTLPVDKGLSHFLSGEQSVRRLVTLSQVKPHIVTHRAERSVQYLSEADVCLENGLKYEYFDQRSETFTSRIQSTEAVSDSCMHRLPEQSSALQAFLYRTPSMPNGLPPNCVIATQCDCPRHMSLGEYKAFCTIPLGIHIQYLNILTQLAMPTIDFGKVETQILIIQTILQASLPSEQGEIERKAHSILVDNSFGSSFISHLEKSLSGIQENWDRWRALANFIQLTVRLLTFTRSMSIAARCADFLARSREVCLVWLEEIMSRRKEARDHEERALLDSKAVEIALVATSTLDLELDQLRATLSIPEAAVTLLRCSITVQEKNPSASPEHVHLHGSMWRSWRTLMYRALPIIRQLSCTTDILTSAVRASWPGFQPEGWMTVDAQRADWLVTKARGPGSSCAVVVHFNLLTALLLVNGAPLSRLPEAYTLHPVYSRLFGKASMEVLPANEAGFKFQARHSYQGWSLSFGMKSTDLLVRISRDGREFDLLPTSLFEQVFPATFARDFVHWYDQEKNQIEFRHLDDPWTSSTRVWFLRKSGKRDWRLCKGDEVLVHSLSATAGTLGKIFSPLETSDFINVIASSSSTSVSVELPRLQLSFHFTAGESSILSRQYREMIIDDDQTMDTLIGFVSRLILKHKTGNKDRIVLIPEGTIDYRATSEHVSVFVPPGTAAKVSAYGLDGILGRLTDNGTLRSKLALCYLHGLTSYCLPDPLTGYTGTETALSILESGAVSSFQTLTLEEVQLLESISKLTPKRVYYPQEKREMQSVSWDSQLASLSQHTWFLTFVQTIFGRASDAKFLYPEKEYMEPTDVQVCEDDLLNRDLIRSSTFRNPGFGAESYTTVFDIPYASRDADQNSERGRRSFLTARMLLRPGAALHGRVPPSYTNFMWEEYMNNGIVNILSGFTPSLELGYDAEWLKDPFLWVRRLWCKLHLSLSASPALHNKFDIVMWLSAAAFAENADMGLIQSLMAFYRIRAVSTDKLRIPEGAPWDLSKGCNPKLSVLRGQMSSVARSFESWRDYSYPQQRGETAEQYEKRRKSIFESKKKEAIQSFATALVNQWPCQEPRTPDVASAATFLQVDKAMDKVHPWFRAWYENRSLLLYIRQFFKILAAQPVLPVLLPVWPLPPSKGTNRSSSRNSESYVTVNRMFSCPKPPIFPQSPRRLDLQLQSSSNIEMASPSTSPFSKLCAELGDRCRARYEKDYVRDLEKSFRALGTSTLPQSVCSSISHPHQALEAYLQNCKSHLAKLYEEIKDTLFNAMGPTFAVPNVAFGNKTREGIASIQSIYEYHLPRICPQAVLQQLNHAHWARVPDDWRETVIKYALAVTELQRARRLISLVDNPLDLAEELCNLGHENWDPVEFPDTLLLEAESGILVRRVQEEIAQHMRNPLNNRNAVMQLNMGEGKSSVIVPIVAAALADGHRLLRVLVAKPQFKQMRQMLISKLGGLLGRRVYYLPFSRALNVGQCEARFIRELLEDCTRNGGVLLLQPEQALSFQLMGIESLICGGEEIGRSLVETQQFLEATSRDIVDESDENFSVKFELVYTMGAQMPIDFSPYRWHIIHAVLDLVAHFAGDVKRQLPNSIEFIRGGDRRYPMTRILKRDGDELLLDMIAEHICKVGTVGLPIMRQPEPVRRAVYRYIRIPQITPDEILAVQDGPFWSESTLSPLFLIRGLIAGGVLSFVLDTKRWRVNFGVDEGRHPPTKLAVPFRAKDSPTPRSEFSHPDVVILLTSLSYYYSGLCDSDMFDTFAHLLKSDQASLEYAEWTRAIPDMPEAIRHLSGVNVKDRVQCTESVFPALRYSTKAINYFLSQLVFPKEMKEFPHKLSASGWDIGKVKQHPTTGFSGTNDSRHLLPLSVKHLDIPSQTHTNALVLSYLLQSENSVELLQPQTSAGMSNAEQLISKVNTIQPTTRVILDAGAQIVELTNQQVAEKWLRMSDASTTEAVVYVNDNDEITVLERSGVCETLQTSPYLAKIDRCIIYLDEAHTRGIDLKLPRDYRAAVTLGTKVTKDKLVQACMRMRKLGKGQSVVFLVPEEIQTKILEQRNSGMEDPGNISVSDVLCWAISETLDDLRASMPLWAVQGKTFEDHKYIFKNKNWTKVQAEKFLEPESQSLEERYRPQVQVESENGQLSGWNMNNRNIASIVKRCRDFEAMGVRSAALQEEQERELSPEIEAERELERPPKMEPHPHEIHPDVRRLVKESYLVLEPSGTRPILPAFRSLRGLTAVASLGDIYQFPVNLLVTADYAQTVKRRTSLDQLDSFQRPVQWVLSVRDETDSERLPILVILSPFEANGLLNDIRKSKRATLHVYSPRVNLGYESLDGLDLYTIGRTPMPVPLSRTLIMQLNLFAGQLYLRSYAEYVELCNFLGLAWRTAQDGQTVSADGFINPPRGVWKMQTSPVNFLKNFITNIRRDRESIAKTHVGRMLEGLLEERDFVTE